MQKIVLTTAAAIGIGICSALPAAASSSGPQPVPEPLTVLGSLAVGGGILGKKIADAKKK